MTSIDNIFNRIIGMIDIDYFNIRDINYFVDVNRINEIDHFKDVYFNIISFLRGKDFCTCFSVSKDFYRICKLLLQVSKHHRNTFRLANNLCYHLSFTYLFSNVQHKYRPTFINNIKRTHKTAKMSTLDIYYRFMGVFCIKNYMFTSALYEMRDHRNSGTLNHRWVLKQPTSDVLSCNYFKKYEFIVMFDDNNSSSENNVPSEESLIRRKPSYAIYGDDLAQLKFDFKTNKIQCMWEGIVVHEYDENFAAFLDKYNV